MTKNDQIFPSKANHGLSPLCGPGGGDPLWGVFDIKKTEYLKVDLERRLPNGDHPIANSITVEYPKTYPVRSMRDETTGEIFKIPVIDWPKVELIKGGRLKVKKFSHHSNIPFCYRYYPGDFRSDLIKELEEDLFFPDTQIGKIIKPYNPNPADCDKCRTFFLKYLGVGDSARHSTGYPAWLIPPTEPEEFRVITKVIEGIRSGKPIMGHELQLLRELIKRGTQYPVGIKIIDPEVQRLTRELDNYRPDDSGYSRLVMRLDHVYAENKRGNFHIENLPIILPPDGWHYAYKKMYDETRDVTDLEKLSGMIYRKKQLLYSFRREFLAPFIDRLFIDQQRISDAKADNGYQFKRGEFDISDDVWEKPQWGDEDDEDNQRYAPSVAPEDFGRVQTIDDDESEFSGESDELEQLDEIEEVEGPGLRTYDEIWKHILLSAAYLAYAPDFIEVVYVNDKDEVIKKTIIRNAIKRRKFAQAIIEADLMDGTNNWIPGSNTYPRSFTIKRGAKFRVGRGSQFVGSTEDGDIGGDDHIDAWVDGLPHVTYTMSGKENKSFHALPPETNIDIRGAFGIWEGENGILDRLERLNVLTPKERVAWELIGQGWTQVEIGDKIGWSQASISDAYNLALEKLSVDPVTLSTYQKVRTTDHAPTYTKTPKKRCVRRKIERLPLIGKNVRCSQMDSTHAGPWDKMTPSITPHELDTTDRIKEEGKRLGYPAVKKRAKNK